MMRRHPSLLLVMTASTSLYRCALLPSTAALHFTKVHRCRPSIRLFSSSTQNDASSHQVANENDDVEQNMGDHHQNGSSRIVNGDGIDSQIAASALQRYQSLLLSVGLEDKLHFLHELPPQRKVTSTDVFCNREINMNGVRAIGFDMDYTLARYKQPAFDKLAFDGAKEKLVKKLGYPKEVLDFNYDHKAWTRGLIIDTQRGNFLKIDRHKYVRVAYHGFQEISSTNRKILYSRTFNKVLSFSEKWFVNMDTLFQFVDAHLFALLIEMKDQGDHESLDFKTYEEIYREVRECVDLCHRDGVIKDEVARDPEKYIIVDKGLVRMLKRFREEGVKLFLLTNSYWEYTSTAMNYLFHEKLVDDRTQKQNEWLDLFDLAIVASCKPAFMLDPYLNLFRVNPEDGSLLNTDGLFDIQALGLENFLDKGKTFQGGNWRHLQALLNIQAGEEILYVGDHLYADVLRSKRTLGWRSAFIVPEIEEEMQVFNDNLPILRQIRDIRQLRDELSQYIEEIRRTQDVSKPEVWEKLENLRKEDGIVKEHLTMISKRWHGAFHHVWGAMFVAGYQDSRFAFYVENYACLYTSRATNLGLSSAFRSFRTSTEMLPHDRLLADSHTTFSNEEPWGNSNLD